MGNIVNSFVPVPQYSVSITDNNSQGNRVNVIVSPSSNRNISRSSSISSGPVPILISSDEESDDNKPTTSSKGRFFLIGHIVC